MKKILIILLLSIIVLIPFVITDKQDVIKNNDSRIEVDCTQNTEELETELQEIILFFDDIPYLKDHLNHHILTSFDQVEQEITKVNHISCFNYEEDENREKEKLTIYVTMLEYYQELLKMRKRLP